MNTVKSALKSALIQEAYARIDNAKESIKRAKETALTDTKSSAGDKFETTRAMMHREIEQYTSQLESAEKSLLILQHLDSTLPCDIVKQGAVVKTSIGCFYLALSGEDIELEDEVYTPISLSSPIGQTLAGAVSGDILSFRDNDVQIKDLF